MNFELSCPIPISEYPVITMAHGSGGILSRQLIEQMFQPAFDNDLLNAGHDGAVLAGESGRLAFTTDSFVVQPIFFSRGEYRRSGRERDRERSGLLWCDT